MTYAILYLTGNDRDTIPMQNPVIARPAYIIFTSCANVTNSPEHIKGIDVNRMVVFLPRASNNDPPISPPTRAAKGIKLPIQEASYLVTCR